MEIWAALAGSLAQAASVYSKRPICLYLPFLHRMNHPPPQRIRAAVCMTFDLLLHELTGRCRRRDLSDARKAAAMLLRQYGTGFPRTTYAMIGGMFGRNHEWAIYAEQRGIDLYETDLEFANKVDSVVALLDKTSA